MSKDSATVVKEMSEIKQRNEFGLLADDISTMVRAIDRYTEENMELAGENVKLDVDLFVGEVEQFDDLTILCLRYHRSALREES